MLSELRKTAFRFYRGLRGRDNCETCPGIRNVRGNENVINGVVMCDDCHARQMTRDEKRMESSINTRQVVQSLRATIVLNRGQSAQALAEAILEVADAIERGDLGLLRKDRAGVRRA